VTSRIGVPAGPLVLTAAPVSSACSRAAMDHQHGPRRETARRGETVRMLDYLDAVSLRGWGPVYS
jgi:hypothetical protein